MHVNRRVGALFRMGEAWIGKELAESGLSSSAAYMVLELAAAGRLSLAELARRVGVDRAHVTRTARSLEASGLATREPDPADGRGSLLSLTDPGRQAATKAEEAILSWVALVSAGVDPADLATTGRTLDRFYENAVRRGGAGE